MLLYICHLLDTPVNEGNLSLFSPIIAKSFVQVLRSHECCSNNNTHFVFCNLKPRFPFFSFFSITKQLLDESAQLSRYLNFSIFKRDRTKRRIFLASDEPCSPTGGGGRWDSRQAAHPLMLTHSLSAAGSLRSHQHITADTSANVSVNRSIKPNKICILIWMTNKT